MTRKFLRSVKKASSFEAWVNRLEMFNCALIKENQLQMWTMADFKTYWIQNGGKV